ncbi:hypothetical protein B7494_g7583 [Chlorociboria aeruginascens]|nr:hypothetical protein B7494_g7583 [Chlorociboria aeruginascens]
MVIIPKLPKSWTIKSDRRRASSRRFVLTPVHICWGFSTFLFLIVFSLLYRLSRNDIRNTHDPGEDMIKHFIGSKDCGIVQSDIYLVPYSSTSHVSPFCNDRATLLEALSNGGRYGFDEPYVGKDCSYRWFSTPEVCMILERFNTIIFVGDDIARSVYAAFNVLLREDLAFGSLQQWIMSDQDLITCNCNNQFLNSDCWAYTMDSSEKMETKEVNERKGSPYHCDLPHAYLAVDNTPASATSIAHFKDLAYAKPNPWQPTPVIFSVGHSSSFDTIKATRALEEWLALATGSERNVPVLFLGPPAFGLGKPFETAPKEDNALVWAFQEEMAAITKQKHTDILGLYNLTLQASSPDGDLFSEKVALVEAMMVINWLSKLETS